MRVNRRARPDFDRHGLDRRHRELRLGRLWAHNQDVKGGRGLEPLVVQAPTTPSRTKPENAGGWCRPTRTGGSLQPRRPGAVQTQPGEAVAGSDQLKLPANGLPPAAPKGRRSRQPSPPAQTASTTGGATPAPAAVQPTDVKPGTAESGPTIASLIDNMSGPSAGWRVQVASVKNEDVAKSTWARLQSAHGDVMANPRCRPCVGRSRRQGRVVPRPGRVPLDEKQRRARADAQSRKADCVTVPRR